MALPDDGGFRQLLDQAIRNSSNNCTGEPIGSNNNNTTNNKKNDRDNDEGDSCTSSSDTRNYSLGSNSSWKCHTIDYTQFKKRLRYYARRRIQIKDMIKVRSNHRLPESILLTLIGPKEVFQQDKRTKQHLQQQQQQQLQSGVEAGIVDKAGPVLNSKQDCDYQLQIDLTQSSSSSQLVASNENHSSHHNDSNVNQDTMISAGNMNADLIHNEHKNQLMNKSSGKHETSDVVVQAPKMLKTTIPTKPNNNNVCLPDPSTTMQCETLSSYFCATAMTSAPQTQASVDHNDSGSVESYYVQFVEPSRSSFSSSSSSSSSSYHIGTVSERYVDIIDERGRSNLIQQQQLQQQPQQKLRFDDGIIIRNSSSRNARLHSSSSGNYTKSKRGSTGTTTKRKASFHEMIGISETTTCGVSFVDGLIKPSEGSYFQKAPTIVTTTEEGAYSHTNPTTTIQKSSAPFTKQSTSSGSSSSWRTITRRLSVNERNEIIVFLGTETDKVFEFYMKQCKRISKQFDDLMMALSVNNENINITLEDGYLAHGGGGVIGIKNSTILRSDENEQNYYISIQSNIESIRNVGNEILELMVFCIINVITLQQILIRYDTFVRTVEGTPMFSYYMKKVTNHKKKPFRHILDHEELHVVADKYATMVLELLLTLRSTISSSSTTALVQLQSILSRFNSSRLLFYDILRSTLVRFQGHNQFTIPTPAITSTQCSFGHICGDVVVGGSGDPKGSPYNIAAISHWLRKTLQSGHKLVVSGFYEGNSLGLEPSYVIVRDDSYCKQMEQLIYWRNTKDYSDDDEDYYYDIARIGFGGMGATSLRPFLECCHGQFLNVDDEEVVVGPHNHANDPTSSKELPLPQSIEDEEGKHHQQQQSKKISMSQMYHLALSLISGFLYCMNYYIIEPSSTLYVNRLGAFDAMSGTLIGMMPLAAFVAAVPYSVWSNNTFRYPFLVSPFLLLIGNLLYSVADIYNSLAMALIGRFICGLGSPKILIRRFMADTTPLSIRTSVNAGFGMVVATGSAMGPAMAVILNRFEWTSNKKYFGAIVTFNGLTLPGYFMAMIWMVYFIIVVLTFKEPDRDGLQEQKELERKNIMLGCPSVMSESQMSTTGTFSSATLVDDDDAIKSIGTATNRIGSVSTIVRYDGLYESNTSRYRNMVLRVQQFMNETIHFLNLLTLPVAICLFLLFVKVFTIEALVSSTSALTKNRYHWQVEQVGTLGFVNGLAVIPFSILIGRLSMTYHDHVLMRWLVRTGCLGLFLVIDFSDLLQQLQGRTSTATDGYNQGNFFAVRQERFVLGYSISYMSIQAFEGIIGSTLSKVIPTALASGTMNSGLLATLIDTSGRASGDLFISAMGYISIRQLMNLLFIPSFVLMVVCLIVIERCRDLLSV